MLFDEDRRRRYFEKIEQLELNFTLSKRGLTKFSKIMKSDIDILDIYGILHAIQLTIEALTDISAMVTKDIGKLVKNNYDNLDELESQGIIINKTKLELYKLVGLRNRIAHDYNGLNDKIALDSFKENVPIIQEFIGGMKGWLKKN